MGAGEAAKDEQQSGPRGGWGFGGGLRANRCLEARVGGGECWCALPEAWGFGWSGGLRLGIFNGWAMRCVGFILLTLRVCTKFYYL